MSKCTLSLALSASLFSGAAFSELKMLDDGDMSGISGQSGLSLDVDLRLEVGEIAYFDDGAGIAIQGIRMSDPADSSAGSMHRIELDVENDGSLNIAYDIAPTRYEFSDIRFGTEAGNISGLSGGGFFWDYQLVGNLKLKNGGALGPSGTTFESSYTLTDGAFGYRTQGNSVWLEDIDATVNSVMTLDAGTDLNGDYLDIRLPSYVGEYTVGAIRHSSNPLESAGSLWGKYDLTSYIQLRGGGRVGTTGITIDSQNTINRYDFGWGDDGNWVGLIGMTGFYNVDNLTIDVAADQQGDLGLAIAWDKVESSLHIDKLLLGETKARIDDLVNSGVSPSGLKNVGSLDFNNVYADQTVDGVDYTNVFYVQAGGHADAGEQGLRFNTEWSLVDSYAGVDNVSNITYTDDGNSIMLSGLQSWGKGDVTLNVTKAETINGTEFFDGLRIGFEDYTGGYKIDGFRVGKDDGQIKDQQLQLGTRINSLGFFPAFDFTVDGHMTIGTGGQSGEGLTINSDIYITNGNAAFIIDENGKGVWATGLDYDIHKRDMTIDVTDDGLAIVEGESWSTIDMSGLRLGSKATEKSFGRFIVKSYEVGSTTTVKAGGAVGDEGVTISLKKILAEAVSDTKRNSFTWETASSGKPMQLVFDNITTNDGDGTTNTYGIQSDVSLDVVDDGEVGFAVSTRTRFKELSVGSVQTVHPDAAQSSTLLYGMKLQNMDIRTNLTARSIP